MLNLVRRINEEIIQQAEDIFEHFGATPIWEIVEYPDINVVCVKFTYETPSFNGKAMLFQHFFGLETEDAFINRIKAYLLDCVDTFVNLL